MGLHAKLQKTIGNDAVVLASGSPRRFDILQKELGVTNLRSVPSQFPEDLPKELYAPFEYVVQTAIRKAIDVYRSEADADVPPGLVLAADTIVVDNGIILEKPRGPEHHAAMLRQLRDAKHPHRVYTGVVAIVPLAKPVAPGYAMETYLGETKVRFRSDITDAEIQKYVESGEGLDAAGGYKIQETGGRFVKSYEGDKFNAVGLPVEGTADLIAKTFRVANESDSESEEEDDEDDDF